MAQRRGEGLPEDSLFDWVDNPGREEWLKANPNSPTAGVTEKMRPVDLLRIRGKNNEHRIMHYPEEQKRVQEILKSILENGYDPKEAPLVIVDQQGKPRIYEGNHRISAAVEAQKLGKLDEIPVETRYLGGSETIPKVFNPRAILRKLLSATEFLNQPALMVPDLMNAFTGPSGKLDTQRALMQLLGTKPEGL